MNCPAKYERGRRAGTYTTDSHPLLSEFPLVTAIPLFWGDEDSFGHVNNLTYLRWADSVRVEYLRAIGLWTEMPPKGPGPILAGVKCDYKAQMKYPDTVYVGTRVVRIGRSSFQMEHRIVSGNLGVVAAVVESTLVFFDYKAQKPTPLTPRIRQSIAEFEGKAIENAEAVQV